MRVQCATCRRQTLQAPCRPASPRRPPFTLGAGLYDVAELASLAQVLALARPPARSADDLREYLFTLVMRILLKSRPLFRP